ncbi:hypothetical protein Gohar_002775, partial [Gossypium harknessii]|nr:hypothetical protein [Gossypium harknessii]
MKAKYYPLGDFMSVSFTWHSIWGVCNLLEKGTGWKIGNGESMNIWNDVCLSSPGDGRVKSQNIDLRYLTIADLIDSESVTWKKLKEDALCPIYTEKEETVAHLFRDCAFTKPVLQEAICYNRNKLYHKGVREWAQEVVRSIKAYISEVKQLEKSSEIKHKIGKESWEPLEGELKYGRAYKQSSSQKIWVLE